MASARVAHARVALAVGVGLLALPGAALANGRLYGTTNVRFHPTDATRFVTGSTIGTLLTTDGGTTESWECENAIGYGGNYDPVFAYHPTRDELWATTYEGLRVSTDGGCTWTSIDGPFAAVGEPPQRPWIGDVDIGSDGKIWVTTSSGDRPNDVYLSTNGADFSSAGMNDDTKWWESVKVAPGNPLIAYVSGYQMAPAEEGFLYRTADGGATWGTPLPLTGITFGMDPRLIVLGVSPADANVVFVRVMNAVEPLGDAVYRSTDGGQNWALVQQLISPLRGFAISPDGNQVFVGTGKLCGDDEPSEQKGCLYASTTGGGPGSFTEAGYSPRMGTDPTPNTSNALTFGPDGALYAGGSNPIDGWVVGKSTDGAATFSKIFALPDIDGPLSCPRGSAQNECAALVWPSVCVQNLICEGPPDAGAAGPPDAGTGGGGDGGCCSVAPSRAALAGGLGLAVLAALVVLRRRR